MKTSTWVLAPLNAVGDNTGCTIVDGHLVTPPGFKEAWKSLYESGWKQIAADPEWGGGGSPNSLQVLTVAGGTTVRTAAYNGALQGSMVDTFTVN